jgi:hypothetical protein
MENGDDPGSIRRDHKVTSSMTQDAFDKRLARLMGLPGGAHTKPSAVQDIDFYGHATSYMIQTVKTDGGETAFISVSASGSVRFILPPRVLATIERQRASAHEAGEQPQRQADRGGAGCGRHQAGIHEAIARKPRRGTGGAFL